MASPRSTCGVTFTSTDLRAGGHQASRPKLRLQKLGRAQQHRHDSPVQREAPGGRRLGCRGKDGHRRSQRRQQLRRVAVLRDRNDRLRITATAQRDRSFAERQRVAGRGPDLDGGRLIDGFLSLTNDHVERLDRPHRVQTDGGLPCQHDGVDAELHRVRGVGDFGARGTQLGSHRFEHLRGDDHGDPLGAGTANDRFLRHRHLFERHLQPQIAPCHHHAVTRFDNLIQPRERRGPLELRN